jgi:hypothetical protein
MQLYQWTLYCNVIITLAYRIPAAPKVEQLVNTNSDALSYETLYSTLGLTVKQLLVSVGWSATSG